MLYFLSAHGVSEVTFPEPAADGDPIALLIVSAVLAAFAVFTVINRRKKANAPAPVEEAPAVQAAPTAPGSAGELKLHNVEPRTAAMLMAIVADKLGKPLNELRFISIKEVE